MKNINDKIVDLKTDIIMLAQDLNNCNQEEIDDYKLTELASNMDAMLKHLKDKHNVKL